VAILFGLIAFALPGMALLTLVFLFGFYALADGVFALIAAFRRTHQDQQPWWALLIHGIVGIIAGLIAFLMPGITALALLYLIAAWALVTGVLQIVAAIRLRKQITGEWLLALSGALSIVFGVLLFLFPGPGALAVVIWIGAYAIVMGILMITLGVRLRKWIRASEPPGGGRGYPAPAH
jgi:uncharacterized membrane protein HdeD (DUF308 family)